MLATCDPSIARLRMTQQKTPAVDDLSGTPLLRSYIYRDLNEENSWKDDGHKTNEPTMAPTDSAKPSSTTIAPTKTNTPTNLDASSSMAPTHDDLDEHDWKDDGYEKRTTPKIACSICSDGLTVDESTRVGTTYGRTCGTLLVDAAKVEERSKECYEMSAAIDRCCKDQSFLQYMQVDESSHDSSSHDHEYDWKDDGHQEDQESACSVCSTGLTVPTYTKVHKNGKTCADLLFDAARVRESSKECYEMKAGIPICCPGSGGEPV